MLIFRVMDRLIDFVARVSWPAVGAAFLLLYVIGALIMPLVEPPNMGIHSLAEYSWWFIVTITTVGYGDLYPVSAAGRVTAAAIMLLGISTIGVVLGKLGEGFFTIGRNRMRGLARLSERNHIVIFGYNAGETEQMVHEIVADPEWASRSIVLCSNVQDENPMPREAKFVHGPLSSDDVMDRACVAEADVIIISIYDDSTTIVTAIAANSVNPRAHIVVNLANPESEKHIRRINPAIDCVVSLAIPLTVQALQDPGVTRVIQNLVSNVSDDVMYRIDVPADVGGSRSWRFGDLMERFKREHEAILVGVSDSTNPGAEVNINPGAETPVSDGMTLFYIAKRRLGQLDWASM
jgi:voltage-gated potassium channel